MTGVSLRQGYRASELFYDVLNDARENHDGAFAGLRWPTDAKAFRKDYAASVIAFERRRLASPDRAAIARDIVQATERAMVFHTADGEPPLREVLDAPHDPLATETIRFSQRAGLVPELTFRGKPYRGTEVCDLVDAWHARHWMTDGAHEAIRWTLLSGTEGGRASFAGQKCVALGAGAELSPTRALLRAGADVLYLDLREPPREILDDPRVSGTVTFVPGGVDLLQQPGAVATTIRAFAGDDPVHIGMYAYSGGAAQEWRLTASMNAIVRSLPSGLTQSVVALISPTTPGRVSEADEREAGERQRQKRRRPLGLGRGPASEGQSGDAPHRVSHSIVPLQGVSYQAAQYIGKMLAAEVFAAFGRGDGSPLTVSAPVAPITKTASLSHPLFDAAFEGAEMFDILISEPQATRVLCALLAFHDLLRPDAPSQASSSLPPAERVAAIFGEQIHGGVYAQPHALEREIAVAALAGLAKSPSLVPAAIRYAAKGG